MKIEGLVFGLLDNSSAIGDPRIAAKYRSLTVSWSRFGYHDIIIEHTSVDEIVAEACSLDFRYCFIQPYGHVIHEHWRAANSAARDFFSALEASITPHDFLVMGQLVDGGPHWYGFQPTCLLVDLVKYRELGQPQFESVDSGTRRLPTAVRITNLDGRITELHGSTEFSLYQPELPGWQFIASSLQAGIPVVSFSDEVLCHSLDLNSLSPRGTQAMACYLNEGIADYGNGSRLPDLNSHQHAFLRTVQRQATESRRGVFLWNIESYEDIESPPAEFEGPLDSLYSVAAGFKPNRILETHGFHPETRVVYFDYSPNALAIKQCLVEKWQGEDFPDFVSYLFRTYPHPATFYQLWQDRTPDDVDLDEIEEIWQRELDRWGGQQRFREHWQAYRELEHAYICCNLLEEPTELLDQIRPQPRALIWWSNAFFTFYGNWFFSLEQRQRAYEHWLDQLATRNPSMYVCGSDHTNANVNGICAASYREHYRREGGDYLRPRGAYQTQIRM